MPAETVPCLGLLLPAPTLGSARALGFVRDAFAFAGSIVTAMISRRPVRPLGDEGRRPLPGDALLPNAKGRLDPRHHDPGAAERDLVLVGAAGLPPGRLVQLRRPRQRRPSQRRRIRPELQQIEVGDLMAWTPRARDGFFVARSIPAALVLTGDAGLYRVVWAFVLEPIDANRTRLLVRASGDYDRPAVWLLLQLVWRPMHFAMERKQLLNLRRRSEGAGT